MKMMKYLLPLLLLAIPAHAQIRSCASLTEITPITGSECVVAYTGAGLMGKTTPSALVAGVGLSGFDTDDLAEGATKSLFQHRAGAGRMWHDGYRW